MAANDGSISRRDDPLLGGGECALDRRDYCIVFTPSRSCSVSLSSFPAGFRRFGCNLPNIFCRLQDAPVASHRLIADAPSPTVAAKGAFTLGSKSKKSGVQKCLFGLKKFVEIFVCCKWIWSNLEVLKIGPSFCCTQPKCKHMRSNNK